MKKLFRSFNFAGFIPQVLDMVQVMRDTIPFIRKNKLWLGLFEHKWIAFFTTIISLLFSWYVLSDLGNLLFSGNGNALMQLGLVDGVSDAVREEGRDALFSGGTKYLFLILLEVITFYFSVRTLAILTNNNNMASFNDFVNAEKRMIKLMAWNFGKGIAAQVIIYIALALVGFKGLTSTAMFFVYAYFIGYAFLDNYNEQFGMVIKESQKIIRQHVGAVTTLGIAITGLLYIPLIGPLVTPILGGVAASIYGNRFAVEGAGQEISFDEINSDFL